MRVMAVTRDPEVTERLELRALERMVRALCEYIELRAREARSHGELDSREAELQLEAFAERRSKALETLRGGVSEPAETRIARLERAIEALDCSRSYFCAGKPA